MTTTSPPEAYRPNHEGAAILKRALAYVDSVPYQPSARWLFYRLLQDGTYNKKSDYKCRFLSLLTRARKAFWEGWKPDTLVDDTREATYGGFGYSDAGSWLQGKIYSLGCTLDKWEGQPNYVEIWFEAAAMCAQFEYYTEHVTLRPFQGDPSLPFKWEIAKHLEYIASRYPGKPIKILYFGDLDLKGQQIPDSAVADIRAWCKVDFELIRCGLNPGDDRRYDLPENPEKPGTYQWEALSDEAAQAMIQENLLRYSSPGQLAEIEKQEERITARFRQEVAAMIERLTLDPWS